MKQISFGAFFLVFLFQSLSIQAQSVTVKEESLPLSTYGFGKPNPVPILAENPKIYPYFKFEEYDHTSKIKNWKVVTLENDYIKVFVLPEIGGKVWGAIEKSTGEEFLYKNEVIKFRNIAMRGPWTSGGIEFNFGIIGHHPSTATAVDYLTRHNDDGSVSCVVGNTDLPSNTRWTVEIRLEKGKAYFETNTTWYNASPLNESYYNWMTAAAEATYDLEFFIPGNKYVEHNGDSHNWPLDPKGRDLSFYKNNTFGSSKSYHIVGEYNDFFGGYYHDKQFGFGQWAPYEEMPGQKLWLWDLSRGGGIWEDLLTDSDGQYIEFQAGRLLDQYSPGDTTNPISQVGFDPYLMDSWSEIWFPYKEIGGMVDASKQGVLNVEIKDDEAYIGINALKMLDNDLLIKVNGESIISERLKLRPMEVFSTTIASGENDKIEVSVKGTALHFKNFVKENEIKRPFEHNTELEVSESEKLLFEGIEALEFREFSISHEKLLELVENDPSHQMGLVKLAELEYRRTNYLRALEHANEVLKMDTYSSPANYMAGIAYRALGDLNNALESLGWAARDIKYRSVAYAQMAEIHLKSKKYERASIYAQKALDFNTYNLNAHKVILAVQRIHNNKAGFQQQAEVILNHDPLDHFTHRESALFKNESNLGLSIQNEFKDEAILQIALDYHILGLDTEAVSTLLLETDNIKTRLWLAYLLRNKDAVKSSAMLNEIASNSIDFVFPYRRETRPVLEWAIMKNNTWKYKYLLAQNYIAVGLMDKGKSLLRELGTLPDSDVFYRFRAKILSENDYTEKQKDIEKAMNLNPEDWKIWEETIQFYTDNNKFNEAISKSKKGYKKFPKNYNIGLAHAKALLNKEEFKKVITVLSSVQILPFEHASESRRIYEQAHIGKALKQIDTKNYSAAILTLKNSKEWPENIGVGKPYNPDERMQDYLLAMSYDGTNQKSEQKKLLRTIVDYSSNTNEIPTINNLFSLLAYKDLGENELYNQLASRLEKSNKTQDKIVLAFIKMDKIALSKLKNQSNLRPNLWEVMKKAAGL